MREQTPLETLTARMRAKMHLNFAELKRLLFESDQPGPALDALRTSDQIAHVESGNVFLIAPDGEVNMVCTRWYAAAWCADHKDWSFKPL